MSDIVNIRDNLYDFEVSPEFEQYTKVEVVIAKGEDNKAQVVTVGDDSGKKMVVQMPQCSDTEQARAAAQKMLDRLKNNIFRYRPYTATDAILDPSAEIGDAISANGVYSTICNVETEFGSLMLSKITAPQDEEIEHEYYVQSSTNKELTRELGQAYSQMAINASAIRAEVNRATEAEGVLRATLELTAEQISAKVDSESTGESFGWTLTPTSWDVKGKGGNTVFSVKDTGAYISGEIVAEKGTIGGFDIKSDCINYNGMTYNNTVKEQGIYFGTSGIKIGKNFTVDTSGNITATNATLSGTLIVGGESITASKLKSGASYGNSYGTNIGHNNTNGYNDAPSYFSAKQIWCKQLIVSLDGGAALPNSTSFQLEKFSWKTLTVDGSTYKFLVAK